MVCVCCGQRRRRRWAGGRDMQVSAVQKLLQKEADGIADAWTFCGSPDDAKWTWDTSINDNLSVSYSCKTRFDRLFFLSPGISDGGPAAAKATAKAKLCDTKPTTEDTAGEGWRPTSFRLIGQDRVPGLGRFPSDHWGLLTCWSPSKTAKPRGALSAGACVQGPRHQNSVC